MKMLDLFPRSVVCEGAVCLPVDADTAWQVVGDIRAEVLTRGLVEKVDVEGEGQGATRHLYLSDGVKISERIEEYNSAERYYVYRMIDVGPSPFTRHLGLASVVAAGGKAIVSWASMAHPLSGDEGAIRSMLQGNIDHVLNTLKAHFGDGA